MGRYKFRVGIYLHGRWHSNAEFKHRWQARLFHLLINRSLNHAGTRGY